MRKLLLASAVAALLVLGASTAKAQTEVYVSDGLSTSGTFTSFTSLAPSPVVAAGAFDGWSFSIFATSDAGFSQPFGLDALTFTATCLGGAFACISNPLDVFVSDINFTQSASELYTRLQVTSQPSTATTTQNGWFNNANGYFDHGTSIGAISVAGGSGSASGTLTASVSGHYSMELEDAFSANGSTSLSSFMANGVIGTTPEPRTMLLFGTGLILFGAILRRRVLA